MLKQFHGITLIRYILWICFNFDETTLIQFHFIDYISVPSFRERGLHT